MSTLVFRDGTMATTLGSYEGSVRVGNHDGIAIFPNGAMCAFTGDHQDGIIATDWFREHQPADGRPDRKLECAGMYVDPLGVCWQFEGRLVPYQLAAPFHALGSGMDLAIGAMEMGATAIEAVEVAMRRDVYSHGPVQSRTVLRRSPPRDLVVNEESRKYTQTPPIQAPTDVPIYPEPPPFQATSGGGFQITAVRIGFVVQLAMHHSDGRLIAVQDLSEGQARKLRRWLEDTEEGAQPTIQPPPLGSNAVTRVTPEWGITLADDFYVVPFKSRFDDDGHRMNARSTRQGVDFDLVNDAGEYHGCWIRSSDAEKLAYWLLGNSKKGVS